MDALVTLPLFLSFVSLGASFVLDKVSSNNTLGVTFTMAGAIFLALSIQGIAINANLSTTFLVAGYILIAVLTLLTTIVVVADDRKRRIKSSDELSGDGD